MNISNTETAKIISQSFANRERIRKETDLRRLRRVLESETGATVPSKDYITYFKELQDNGYGQIIWGPRKAALRFLWKKNMRQTGQFVLNSLQGTNEDTGPVEPVAPPPKTSTINPFKVRKAPETVEQEIAALVQVAERKRTGLSIAEKVQFMLLLEKMLGL